jgi:hypothetical protein
VRRRAGAQAIRANTTICLGNLARYMGDASCKRVLLNAFTRALKDTFPPTRAAGMITLVATAQYYDAAEVATRIIPAVRSPRAAPPLRASPSPPHPGMRHARPLQAPWSVRARGVG